jgi:hypothetical protein
MNANTYQLLIDCITGLQIGKAIYVFIFILSRQSFKKIDDSLSQN